MEAFTRLFVALDQTNRTSEKVDILSDYFATIDDADGIWTVALLSGHRIRRPVSPTHLRLWIAEISQLPQWLVDTCYDRVGDLAETLALLHPTPPQTHLPEAPRSSLAQWIEDRVLPLRNAPADRQREIVVQAWQELSSEARFLYNKLLTGAFRVGVQKKTVINALARAHRQDPRAIAQSLTGDWYPNPSLYQKIRYADRNSSHSLNPFPFCLAHPLGEEEKSKPGEKLGDLRDWLIEWKWDGIRAQLVRRWDGLALWSRGEEMLNESFPEILELASRLPHGTVLDGEILAWKEDLPLPFGDLQKRLGRKKVGKKILQDYPCRFLAYDLLESDGRPLVDAPTEHRRSLLEQLSSSTGLPISPLLPVESWEAVRQNLEQSRARRVEGFMLKHRLAPYHAGRVKGGWWKWKVDPLSVDALLLYAQAGHGRRAGLYTDYTLAVRHEDQWVPFAKAYSGLDDKEIRRVDAWVRRHTTDRFGPVRAVEPGLVFEIGFEAIRSSSRHKCGLAVRFPRILRWREDLGPDDVDTLEDLRSFLPD